ncbi:MAG: hypothetical protein SX243_07095 [Acidobacteriota bacterium]|nr:hypothetical protein [Acidobacteriota bacterium]
MADNGKPVFQQVYYLNPFASLPPGWNQTGVVVDVNPPADPTDLVLAGRLRLETAQVLVTLGATPTQVRLLPAAPLSATGSYAVDVQWVAEGTDPNNINWSNTATTSTSPVITSYQHLVSGQLVAGTLRLAFEPGSGGIVPTGANLTIFDSQDRSAGFLRVEGTDGDVSFTPGASAPYSLYLQGVLPITGSGTGTFDGPYTMGPVSAVIPIPTEAPSVSAASYDGDAVRVSWQAPAPATNSGPTSYRLLAQSSEGAAVEEPAAEGGASAVVGEVGSDTWSVSGRTVQGQIVGLPGTAVDLLSEAPVVTGVLTEASQVTASVTVPSGSAVKAWIRAGEAVVAGPEDESSGAVTFDYAAGGSSGLTVVAQASAAGPPSLTGPFSAPVPILGRAPLLRSVVIETDSSDSTKWSLSAVWDPAEDPQVTGYELALMQGTTTVTSTTSGNTLSVTKSSLTNDSYSVTVMALGAGGSKSPAAEQPVLFTGPLLASTTVPGGVGEDGALQATWAAPTETGAVEDPSYVVVIYRDEDGSEQEVYRSSATPALTASLPLAALPLNGEDSYTVGLLVTSSALIFDAGSDGTAQTRAPILLGSVTGFYSATAVAGTVTLHWSALTGAGGYLVQVDDEPPVSSANDSYALPTAPAANQAVTVRIAATATSDGVTATGPWAGPWPVLTTQTVLTQVSYDGTYLTVSWQPVAGATGYQVTVLDGGAAVSGATATAGATDSTVIFDPGLTDTSKTYTVAVQVLQGASETQSSGPLSRASDVFTAGWFPSRVAASTAAPYVFPAQTLAQATAATLGTSGSDIDVYLGDLGAGTTLQGLPISSSNSSFTLAASGNSTRPYQLTIAGSGAAWTFDTSPIRSDLAQEVVSFLQSVENAGAVPWGIAQLQLTLARAMPQTFQELLYYSYGLSFPGGSVEYGSVDLRPGMVLRVASSDYLNVGGTNTTTWLAGYTGTTVTDYEVGSYQSASGWMVGMDAFIAQLVANGALSVNPPPSDASAGEEGGLAEGADLFYPSFQQPFYRLFIPTTLLSASQTGSTNTAANFTLAAADNYTALTTTVNVPSDSTTVAYFRGRSVLKVLIRVLLDGQQLLVPVGTTVGNLLDRLAQQPTVAAGTLTGLRLTRSLGPVAFSANQALAAGARWPVDLAWDGLQVYGASWDALSLPLLHGDVLTLGS